MKLPAPLTQPRPTQGRKLANRFGGGAEKSFYPAKLVVPCRPRSKGLSKVASESFTTVEFFLY